MHKFFPAVIIACSALLNSTLLLAADTTGGNYAERPEGKRLIDELVAEGLDREHVTSLLAGAKRQQKILDAIARPAEKTLTWAQYRKIFVQKSRFEQGEKFRAEHRATLIKAEQELGVDREIILAILGIETRYGRQRGGYRVIDALSTLAFDYPPRSTFFTGQLKELFRLEQKAHIDAATITGSYAGAMGYPQFIPSSYLNFAVDFDQDGKTDLVDDPVDAIGSVANYFSEHGWKRGEAIAARAHVKGKRYSKHISEHGKPDMTLAQAAKAGITPVTCKESEHCFRDGLPKDAKVALLSLEGDHGTEFWLVTQNFWVITRYNHSPLYAMAAYQLSREFAQTEPDQNKQ